MTIICNKCGQDKELADFHTYKTGLRAGKRRSACIECTRSANTAYYARKDKKVTEKTEEQVRRHAEVQKRWRNEHRAELIEYAKEYRREHWEEELEQRSSKAELYRERLATIKSVPCCDCGRSYPSFVMDFDHRDPTTKSFTLATAVTGTRSWESIEAEIAKCDIVCSNCHRIRTAKSLGWLRDLEK